MWPLSEIVDSAIRRLVSAEHFYAGSLVSMPMIYPSGASVVLELSSQAGRIFISDRGGGYQEAELLGAERLYSREASQVAADAGIRFDGREISIVEVPIENLAGAMAIVASCSANAAHLCSIKFSEREDHVRETLFDRLNEVFGPKGFEKNARMFGASNHKWHVDAVVTQNHGLTLFSAVTKSHISAAGTAAKFHDFARLENAPRRVAVVVSAKEMGDWMGVIAPAATAVLEISAANDRFLSVGQAG